MTSERLGPVEFDAATDTFRLEYDPSAVAPSRAVCTALERITGRDAEALAPLHETVDLRGLDAVLEGARTNADRSPVRVSFRYHGLGLTVFSDGVLEVRPVDGDACADEE